MLCRHLHLIFSFFKSMTESFIIFINLLVSCIFVILVVTSDAVLLYVLVLLLLTRLCRKCIGFWRYVLWGRRRPPLSGMRLSARGCLLIERLRPSHRLPFLVAIKKTRPWNTKRLFPLMLSSSAVKVIKPILGPCWCRITALSVAALFICITRLSYVAKPPERRKGEMTKQLWTLFITKIFPRNGSLWAVRSTYLTQNESKVLTKEKKIFSPEILTN